MQFSNNRYYQIVCCKAVRSAILATAWLLVNLIIVATEYRTYSCCRDSLKYPEARRTAKSISFQFIHNSGQQKSEVDRKLCSIRPQGQITWPMASLVTFARRLGLFNSADSV